MPGHCGACGAPCVSRMYQTHIPFFKVASSLLDTCLFMTARRPPGGLSLSALSGHCYKIGMAHCARQLSISALATSSMATFSSICKGHQDGELAT